MKALGRDVAEDFDAKLYLFLPTLSTSCSSLLTHTYICTSDLAAYA